MDAEPGDVDAVNLPVVGVGASAGGLEALRQMLAGCVTIPRMAFVVVQHLDPNHESMMAQLVERYTKMSVHQIAGGESVQPGCVYIIPPGNGLTIEDGVLRLTEFIDPRGMRRPIDDFFEALALDAKELSACVILSGTGADGASGLRAIKEHGGICVAQEPETARYDGMPLSARGTGLVDFVEEPEDIIGTLLKYFERKQDISAEEEDASYVADNIDELCRVLRDSVGHDFSNYKRTTLMRRVERRMQVLGIETGEHYLERLKADSEECEALFRDLLINVTRFFRDPDAFEVLRRTTIEPMVREAGPDDELRVWVPGCSSGEEAYTIAMLFADACESLDRSPIVQIFASDIDEQMLQVAREGHYPVASLADVPETLRNRYTVGRGDHFTVSPGIRDMVRFSAHSVIKDPPFSKINLISCRNLLIYFDDSLQQAVLPMFHYALKPGGTLFLGPSETIGRVDDLFDVIDQRSRVFHRTNVRPSYPLELPMSQQRKPRKQAKKQSLQQNSPNWIEGEAVRRLTETYAPASMLVDAEGMILSSWGPVGRYLDFPAERETRFSAVTLAKPGLREVLGGFVRQMAAERRRQIARGVRVESDFGTQTVTLMGEPVRDRTFLVVIKETGDFEARAEDGFIEMTEADDQVHLLEDELRITRHRLRSTVEELETANEELKSSNEEMMSMNEELQSTNEELTTVNDELKTKVDQLTIANADLKNFFDSTQLAVVILDDQLRIRSFTDAATAIFPLQGSDRGRHLSEVTHLLEDDRYLTLARKVADDGQIIDDRFDSAEGGRVYAVRIMPYRRLDGSNDGATMVFTDVTEPLRLERELADKRERLEMALNVARIGVWEYYPESGRANVDEVVRRLFGVRGAPEMDAEELLGQIYPDDLPSVQASLDEAIESKGDYEVAFRIGKEGENSAELRWLRGLGRMQTDDMMVGVNFDTTAERRILETRELLLREMNHRIKNLFAVVGGMIAIGAREADDLDGFTKELRNRVAAMGQAHTLSYNPDGDQAVELSILLKELVAPSRYSQEVMIEGPAIDIAPTKVTPLTLIFHEWLTNAVKYGALSFGNGMLDISWTVEKGELVLDWNEKIPGDAKSEAQVGFGTRLIEATVRQLKAKSEGKMRKGRFERRLVIPDISTK